ncbi:MAG: outer membrane biosynthesis protein TonB [Candidatus Omnitrophota bacterium]|jgi:outer membrane biosynthesis protein TonB
MHRRFCISLSVSTLIHFMILFPVYTNAENHAKPHNASDMNIHMRIEPPRIMTPKLAAKQLGVKQAASAPVAAQVLMNQPKTKEIFTEYFNKVRERIIKSASVYEKREGGEAVIPVNFIIKRDGSLDATDALIRLGSPKLSALAEKIVIASAPFGPFPESIEHQKVSFLINIEFRPSN